MDNLLTRLEKHLKAPWPGAEQSVTTHLRLDTIVDAWCKEHALTWFRAECVKRGWSVDETPGLEDVRVTRFPKQDSAGSVDQGSPDPAEGV